MTENAAQKATDTEVAAPPPSVQHDINEAEWVNPDNWGGPKSFAVYFSKRDKRTWVKQAPPSIGYTVNLAHTSGIFWMIGLCLAIIILLVVTSILAFS